MKEYVREFVFTYHSWLIFEVPSQKIGILNVHVSLVMITSTTEEIEFHQYTNELFCKSPLFKRFSMFMITNKYFCCSNSYHGNAIITILLC